ncbi:MAG: hypothetical protein HQ561_16550 [Desulfobacteraceae bacterium]|nr:hypothetical protein [Desulfobacteraceae bacterium]
MKRIFGIIVVFLGVFILAAGAWAEQGWQTINHPVKIFEEGYIQVVGTSEEGQTRYRAMRAATVVAQRDLLEVLEGLRLYGQTTVRDGMLQSDQIRTSVDGFLRGATKCGEKFYGSRGYAEVCMRLYIRGKGGLFDIILPLMKDNNLMPKPGPYYKPKLIPKVLTTPSAPAEKPLTKAPPEVKPEAVPEVARPSELKTTYDGLIIDVRAFQFKPALVNTIVTENDEIVFDPSKILSNVLVERGCGGFTTDPNKAKALLVSWGSKSPMTLQGIAVVKSTNAKISADDAAAVFVHDKKSNILAQAKVVFLLK